MNVKIIEALNTAGVGFGITSGVITTLGLITGVYASTGSRLAIIGSLVTVAVADSCSDAVGIHTEEEIDKDSKPQKMWKTTIVTLVTKSIIALTFIIPFYMWSIQISVWISLVWGTFLLIVFSYAVARYRRDKAWRSILKHISIAIIVIVITFYIGIWVHKTF